MRGQRGRGYGVLSMSLLGALLLAAPILANANEPRVWGPGVCRVAWCQPSAGATPLDDIDARLQEAADVAELSTGDCMPASKPRPGEIPAQMVLRQPGGTVERVPWTYPAPAGSWVWALCYGD